MNGDMKEDGQREWGSAPSPRRFHEGKFCPKHWQFQGDYLPAISIAHDASYYQCSIPGCNRMWWNDAEKGGGK